MFIDVSRIVGQASFPPKPGQIERDLQPAARPHSMTKGAAPGRRFRAPGCAPSGNGQKQEHSAVRAKPSLKDPERPVGACANLAVREHQRAGKTQSATDPHHIRRRSAAGARAAKRCADCRDVGGPGGPLRYGCRSGIGGAAAGSLTGPWACLAVAGLITLIDAV